MPNNWSENSRVRVCSICKRSANILQFESRNTQAGPHLYNRRPDALNGERVKGAGREQQDPPTFPPCTMQTTNLIKRSPGSIVTEPSGTITHASTTESRIVESSANWFAYRWIERAACRGDQTKSNETSAEDPSGSSRSWCGTQGRVVERVCRETQSDRRFVETRAWRWPKASMKTLASRESRDNEERQRRLSSRRRGSKKRGRFADEEYDATLVKASAKKRLPYRAECRSR